MNGIYHVFNILRLGTPVGSPIYVGQDRVAGAPLPDPVRFSLFQFLSSSIVAVLPDVANAGLFLGKSTSLLNAIS